MLKAATMLQVARPDRFFAQLDSFDEIVDLCALNEVEVEEEEIRRQQRQQPGDRGVPDAYS